MNSECLLSSPNPLPSEPLQRAVILGSQALDAEYQATALTGSSRRKGIARWASSVSMYFTPLGRVLRNTCCHGEATQTTGP